MVGRASRAECSSVHIILSIDFVMGVQPYLDKGNLSLSCVQSVHSGPILSGRRTLCYLGVVWGTGPKPNQSDLMIYVSHSTPHPRPPTSKTSLN